MIASAESGMKCPIRSALITTSFAFFTLQYIAAKKVTKRQKGKDSKLFSRAINNIMVQTNLKAGAYIF